MIPLISQQLLNAIEKYHTDVLFLSELKRVRASFLAETGLTTLGAAGRSLVGDLLYAQAMQNLMDGYSGSARSSSHYEREAIGLALGWNCDQVSSVWRLNAQCVKRYGPLHDFIVKLGHDLPTFAELWSDFVKFDLLNPVSHEE